MFKTFKHLKWTIIFPHISFFLIKCASFFFKLKFLTLMIKRTKGIEIDEIQFYKTFEHIWFQCVLGSNFLNFEDVT